MNKWFIDVLINKYTDFSGRATRREFWMFYLYSFIAFFAVGMVARIIDFSGLYFVAIFALIIPQIAMQTRRLHDHDMSGWWQLFSLIPLLGPLVLLFFMIKQGQETANRFGPNPRMQAAAESAPVAAGDVVAG